MTLLQNALEHEGTYWNFLEHSTGCGMLEVDCCNVVARNIAEG